MPSHFSSIGLSLSSEEEFLELKERVMPAAKRFPVDGGEYRRWTGDGVELWFQLDQEGQGIGMNPHFAGESRNSLELTHRIRREQDTTLDGAFYALAAMHRDEPLERDCPLVFDLPNAALVADVPLPAIAEVQLAAFAHTAECFESAEAFAQSQTSSGIKYAPRFFIASGTFFTKDANAKPPSADAMFCGEVIRSGRRTNPLSGLQFDWALVDTHGGQYDVVLDPELLGSVPAVGNFLKGTFWISGRLMPPSGGRAGWLSRLFRSR